MLRERGRRRSTTATPNRWRRRARPDRGRSTPTIEPDLSNAGAVPGRAAGHRRLGDRAQLAGRDHPGRATPPRDPRPRSAPTVHADADGLTVRPARRGSQGVDLDLHDVGELTPVIAAVARSPTARRTCAASRHLRGPRDRPAGRARDRDQRGSAATSSEHDDGLSIRPRPLHGGMFAHLRTTTGWRTPPSCSALRSTESLVENVGTTGKTFPDFADVWRRCCEPA